MAQINSFDSKASLRKGFGQTMRTLLTTVAAITAVLVLAGTILGLSGCSNDKTNLKETSSTQSSQSPAAGKMPGLRSVKLPTKTNVKHVTKRAPVEAYSNSAYGISFHFPSQYVLTTLAQNEEKSTFPEDVPNNFVQPGGIPLATIELPSGSATSFFSVSVNNTMSAWQCQQFAVPNSQAQSKDRVSVNERGMPSTVSYQGLGFAEVENTSEQEDVRYYHHFEPTATGPGGTCYEFAMGVEDSRVSSKTLDRPEVFEKLESILATVELKSQPFTRVTYLPPSESGDLAVQTKNNK